MRAFHAHRLARLADLWRCTEEAVVEGCALELLAPLRQRQREQILLPLALVERHLDGELALDLLQPDSSPAPAPEPAAPDS